MAFLSSSSSAVSKNHFTLENDETTMGRHPDCDLVLDAGAVSRFHAKIVRSGTDFVVEDSGSRNGTFLNGQLLSVPQKLCEGDQIRISDVDIVFHTDEVPEFASSGGSSEVTFDGANFGILMVDDQDADVTPDAKVEYRRSADGLKMSATPEAKLEALMRINSNLSNALALDEVLPNVLDSLFDIFPAADRGFVVMQGEEGELTPRWVKTRNTVDATETVRISRTIIRQVMESGQAILSLDASEDSRFDSSESIADFSIRSMICAPLCDGEGNAFGALQIDSTQGRGQFRDDDVDLLSGVATQAGVVINNAKMYEQALVQREVEQDLKLATDVQKAFLPQEQSAADGFEVCSYYQAANHIGGDYFDYIHLPDGRVGVIVADVVGHGVAAAMFMAKLSAETRFCLASIPELSKAVEMLNDRMSGLHVDRFVTLVMMVLDPNRDTVSIVNAGHMPPVLRRAEDGSISEPGGDEAGLPIAIDTGMEYESVDIPFRTGDIAVLYTDGINEAMNASDEEFGMERVRDLTAAGGDAGDVTERIISAVRDHIGSAPPFDDMCLVVIERTSGPENQIASNTETVGEDVIETII